MSLRANIVGGMPVLRLEGRFDAHQVPPVTAWLAEQLSPPPPHLVVDLSAVTFVDSRALGALVQGMKRCREHGGELYLAGMTQPVRIIFELTRLERAFAIFPTVDAAVASRQ